jgi:HD-like signal output (HDOD) protein
MADMNYILDGIDGIAALPQTVLEVTAMLSGPGASAAELEQVARRDEALSMTILRWANSALHGRPGRTFTLRESIARLGNATLLKIVLQQKTSAMFARAGTAYDLQRGALWRSAVGGALAAESIGRRAGFESPDLGFLCALLRDIGKLALDAHFGGAYMDLVTRHTRPERTFVEAERAAFGFDHASLGAELAARWGLPDRIADAIAFHHDPPPPGPSHDTLFDIVHAADIISLWAGLAIGFDGLQYRLADHVRTGLDLSRPAAERLVAETWAGLRRTEAMMAPPAHQGTSA